MLTFNKTSYILSEFLKFPSSIADCLLKFYIAFQYLATLNQD